MYANEFNWDYAQESCSTSGERAFELDREQLGQRTVNVHSSCHSCKDASPLCCQEFSL